MKTFSRREFTIIAGDYFLRFQIILYSVKVYEQRVRLYCDENHH